MFENFQINEISQGLINRAKNKAREISKDSNANPFDRPIKARQADKFYYSKDRNLVNLAKSLGFEFSKRTENEYDLEKKGDYIFIFNKQGDYNRAVDMDDNPIQNLSYIDSNTLRKLKKFETELKKSIQQGESEL